MVPPYNFGSFTLSEGLFLQRIAQLQAENAVLLREVGANVPRPVHRGARGAREGAADGEGQVHAVCQRDVQHVPSARTALNAEEKLRKAQAEQPRDGPDADAEADADAAAAASGDEAGPANGFVEAI